MFDDLKSKLSPDQKTYLFPDEIQEIKVWEKVVKYTFDNVWKNFSPNSISNYIKSENRKINNETIYSYLESLRAFI